MDQLTELRPPDFTDVTKWWIFSNKSLLVCLGGGVIAYLLFKITAMIHLAFLGVWLGVMLEVGLFIGVTFPVPDFGSSLLAFGGRTADELIISLIASFVLNHLSVLGQGFDLSGMMGGGYYMGGDGSAAISIIPPWLMLAALVFATLVGLVAGILPANKAVKISALEAIRHD